MRFVTNLACCFPVFLVSLVKRFCLAAFISDILVCCFRGEVIIGGFVVKELSSDPPSCLVTYLTRVDLKGRLSLVLRAVFERSPR